ncbi:MAG: MbnP family protein, partial [Polyangiales bacterium]
MKKLVILVSTLAAIGCGDSNNNTGGSGGSGGEGGSGGAGSQDVAITVAAMVGEVEFACGDSYENLGSDDTTLSLVDFRFYVQDVELKNADGAWVPIALENNQFQIDDIALLDFEDGCGEVGNADLNDQIVGTVPEGEYDGLRFKMGLPAELNHQD